MADSTAVSYLDEAFRAFRGYKRMADGALSQVDDREFFHVPDAESNSVALIVKHVAGNLRSRWTDFLTVAGQEVRPSRAQVAGHVLHDQSNAVGLGVWNMEEFFVVELAQRAIGHALVAAKGAEGFVEVGHGGAVGHGASLAEN